MSEQLREALSAAVDGEASEFELRRVFDELAKDESLSHAWQSYHLIKQAAQGENVEGVADMGQRIWASLDAEEFLEQDILQEEPSSTSSAVPMQRRWGLIGGAMAAAVALAIVAGGNFSDQLDDDGLNGSAAPEIAQTTGPDLNNADVQSAFSVDPDAATPMISNFQSASYADSEQLIDELGTAEFGEDYDWGPGFVPYSEYSELSPADQARSDGYYLHHVQHQAVNNDSVLSFVKMISYPE